MWAGHCRSIQGASSVNIWLGWRVSSNLSPSDISRYPIGLLSQECNERHSDLAFISTLFLLDRAWQFDQFMFSQHITDIYIYFIFILYILYYILFISMFDPIFLYERCFAVFTWLSPEPGIVVVVDRLETLYYCLSILRYYASAVTSELHWTND